jgi:hypothetical protein
MQTIWTIALISLGVVTPTVQQIGSFSDEKDCTRALVELKSQELGSKLKGVCVPQIIPPAPPPPPPVKPPTPTESISSSDAKSRKK